MNGVKHFSHNSQDEIVCFSFHPFVCCLEWLFCFFFPVFRLPSNHNASFLTGKVVCFCETFAGFAEFHG